MTTANLAIKDNDTIIQYTSVGETIFTYDFTILANDELKVSVDNALQVLGGHGYIRDYPVEMWLRNARGFASFEGLAIV